MVKNEFTFNFFKENKMPMTLKQYSEKAIAIYGDTKLYKDEISALGGKYNHKLRDGAGWIFPATKKQLVADFVNKKNAEEKNNAENKVENKTESKVAAKEFKVENKKEAKPQGQKPFKKLSTKSSIETFRDLLTDFSIEELVIAMQETSQEILKRYNNLSTPQVTKEEELSEQEDEKDEETDDEDKKEKQKKIITESSVDYDSDEEDSNPLTPLKF